MKKITFMLLLAATTGYSQFSGGFKGGLLIANQKFESTLESGGIKPSYYVGGFLEYKLRRIVPELEITYNAGGSEGSVFVRPNFDDREIEYDSGYEVNSIMILAASKFYITNRFALKIGGFYSSILSIKNKVDRHQGQKLFEADYSKFWEKEDFGAQVGLQFDFSKHIFIESSYSLGLNDLRDTSKNEVYSRGFKLGGGYRF